MEPQPDESPIGWSLTALVAAGAAALAASACCIAPLVFVLLGVSGAWIGSLAGLEPYQPYFLAAAAVAMMIAWRKLWRTPACTDGRACAAPAARRGQKRFFVAVGCLLLVVLGFPLVAPFFY